MSARAPGRYSSDLRRGPVVKVLLLSSERAHVHGDLPPARAAGPRAGGGGRATRRPRGAHPRPAGVHARRLLRAARGLAARCGGVRRELPREHPGGDRPRQGDPSVDCPTRSSSWADTAPRSRRARSWSTPPAPSTASSRARARQISPPRAGGGARRSRGPARAAGRGHARRRGAAAAVFADLDAHLPARDLLPQPPQVLHRRARSRGVDRVHARLPVGLLVLQRLDVLRAQLPAPRAAS